MFAREKPILKSPSSVHLRSFSLSQSFSSVEKCMCIAVCVDERVCCVLILFLGSSEMLLEKCFEGWKRDV